MRRPAAGNGFRGTVPTAVAANVMRSQAGQDPRPGKGRWIIENGCRFFGVSGLLGGRPATWWTVPVLLPVRRFDRRDALPKRQDLNELRHHVLRGATCRNIRLRRPKSGTPRGGFGFTRRGFKGVQPPSLRFSGGDVHGRQVAFATAQPGRFRAHSRQTAIDGEIVVGPPLGREAFLEGGAHPAAIELAKPAGRRDSLPRPCPRSGPSCLRR
jgi:hypothetical protein